jgi:hypothetical protein
MSLNWQDIVALLLVMTATVYLVRQAWLVLRRKREAGCGGCSKCPAPPSNQQLLSLDARTNRSPR